MNTPSQPQIIQKKRSFWVTAVWGFTFIIMTALICAMIVITCSMHATDRRVHDIVAGIDGITKAIPTIKESLPPVLSDVINDQRRPDCARQLDVVAKVVPEPNRIDSLKAAVEIKNKSSDVVSLLSLRVVVLNRDNTPLVERNEWAATPVAGDHHWRGPLLPGSKRAFLSGPMTLPPDTAADGLRVEVEVTDVRVWLPEKPTTHSATPAVHRPTSSGK